MSAVLVNGREYEWGDISLVVNGVSIVGFRGIKYGPKQEQEGLHAKGYKALAVQKGNIDYDGEIILTQSEATALDAASGGNLLNIRNANMVVQYGDPSTGIPAQTVVLIGISWGENKKDWKQGQKFAEITIPFIYLDEK